MKKFAIMFFAVTGFANLFLGTYHIIMSPELPRDVLWFIVFTGSIIAFVFTRESIWIIKRDRMRNKIINFK